MTTTQQQMDYSQLSPAEMLALIQSQANTIKSQADNITTLSTRKTRRIKSSLPVFYDHYTIYPWLAIPYKLTKDEKTELIEELKLYTDKTITDDFIKELIKNAKKHNEHIIVNKIEHYVAGKSTTTIYIYGRPADEWKKTPTTTGSNLLFTPIGEVDILHHLKNIYKTTKLCKHFEEGFQVMNQYQEDNEWIPEKIFEDNEKCVIPDDAEFIEKTLSSPTKQDLKDVFQLYVLGNKNCDASGMHGHAQDYYIKKLFLKSNEELKIKRKGKGQYVGSTLSNMKGTLSTPIDLANPEERKKHIVIKYSGQDRCSVLLEKEGKQRCTAQSSWKLPNGKRICSAHAGNVIQTNYLLEKAGKSPENYEAGTRAGWCENECENHDCVCEKNVEQQNLCKATYATLSKSERLDYKLLKNRKITSYASIFVDFEMD